MGDLGYYAPGNDLVLYYGDQSYFPGIVILGRLDGDAAEQIARRIGRARHRDRRGTADRRMIELQDFLDHVNSGAPIEGGSEQHRFMHDAAQEALRITAEINTGYRTTRRGARPAGASSPARRSTTPSSSSRRSTASSART